MLKLRVFMQDILTPFRAILLGFFLMILLGALLLKLPISSMDRCSVPFIDALFTSASASCVTGLIIYDTATHWSLFGKFVIIVLIQIGGIGVITALTCALLMAGKKIGLLERVTLQDSVGAPSIGGIIRFVRFLISGTILIETFGALLLFPVFVKEFGLWKGIGYAFFHSISAFCNAGFDLMGVKQTYSSLTSYSNHLLVNLVIMALIVIGGIGFMTWMDLLKGKPKVMKLQTKVILVSTACLILFPFLYFFFIEFREIDLGERTLLALFQTITPRTAGFNTYDYGSMSDTGLLITILLMMTGGAPGSTAGGMKVTTVFVIVLSTHAFLRRQTDVNIFKRRIGPDVVQSSLTIFTVYLELLLLGTLLISNFENMHLMQAMFECASALGTVGLTTGVTPALHDVSKIILILFMYFGRVGGLTVGYAIVSTTKKINRRYPEEKVTVG